MNLHERNQKVRSFFNEKIDTYDNVHSTFINTKNAITDNLDKETKRVLDLGAGTGLELIYLFHKFPKVEITVIDITENMINKLKERSFADHITTICGDFFEVEFGNDYDAVISTSTLHHFTKEEKEILYKKIYNCLKTNGQFINSDRIALTNEFEEKQLYELNHKFEEYKHLDIPLTIEHEKEILKGVGFKEIESKDVDIEDYRLIKARKR